MQQKTFKGTIKYRQDGTPFKYYPYKVEKANSLLLRARSGHSRVRFHLHRLGMETNNVCRYCSGPPETIDHLALRCASIASEALERLRNIFKEKAGSSKFQEIVWRYPTLAVNLLEETQKAGAMF